MSEKELTTLLRSQIRRNTKRGWRCPDNNQLAAYLNGQSDQKRSTLEAHFADCKSCLETLAFLTRTVDEPALESVPSHLISKARSLAVKKPITTWRWAFAAATACLLLVFSIAVWKIRSVQNQTPPTDLIAQKTEPPRPVEIASPTTKPSRNEPIPPVQKPKPTEGRAPLVRGENDQLKPTLISPREGSVLRSAQQPIRWQPVADASFYEVSVVSEDGSPVFTERTSNTEFQMKGLPDGGKFFVRVVAHLSGGRTVRSDLVGFRLSAP